MAQDPREAACAPALGNTLDRNARKRNSHLEVLGARCSQSAVSFARLIKETQSAALLLVGQDRAMFHATPPSFAKPAAESAAPPDVAIVITTYNHAHFLGEALESALNQSHAPAGVIVVDDGSSDDPAAVVARYPGVRLIRQHNQGLAAARNTGWRAARSRFIVFLDADDRLLPDALATNLRRFDQQPQSAFVYGGYRWIDDNGRLLGTVPPQEIGTDAYEAFLCGNQIGMHATVMYRRDCLEAAGGFDERLRACEDYDLYLRIARRHPVASGTACIAEYRRHGSNMSASAPLMLHSALSVLRRQYPNLADAPHWAAAYRRGLRDWKRIYIGAQLARAWHAVRRQEVSRELLVSLMRVFALAPAGFPLIALRAAGRRLRSRFGRKPVGRVDLGDLRRTTPISPVFGYDRGRPIDRRFIESFLARHAEAIRGRVLEIGDNSYTKRFGGERVTRSDVLHVSQGAPQATLLGDLENGNDLPSDAFDCIVLTQTLHLLFDLRRAVATLHRLLKPGGVLLITVPGVSSVDRGEWGFSWQWSFTASSLRRLLELSFPVAGIGIEVSGNVLAAVAFLHGLADHELDPSELDAQDPHYPVIVAARAVKEARPDAAPSASA
jgi:glycosyltransferase involved in cell wall biosynthesis/SAM-dependent methyltransferase